MLAPALPRGYNERLRRAFPDSRVRWSENMERWLLERKATYGRIDIDPATYPADAIDTFIQRRDGFYTAGVYAPNRLPPIEWLIGYLRAQIALVDRNGGPNLKAAMAIADALEAREAAEEARKYNAIKREFVEQTADLMANERAWDDGRRVAVPRSYERGARVSNVRECD